MKIFGKSMKTYRKLLKAPASTASTSQHQPAAASSSSQHQPSFAHKGTDATMETRFPFYVSFTSAGSITSQAYTWLMCSTASSWKSGTETVHGG